MKYILGLVIVVLGFHIGYVSYELTSLREKLRLEKISQGQVLDLCRYQTDSLQDYLEEQMQTLRLDVEQLQVILGLGK